MDNRDEIRELLVSRTCSGSSSRWSASLELAFDAMDLPADPGLTLTAYTAEPGSPSEDGLRLLASWAATVTATDAAAAIGNPDHTPTGKDQWCNSGSDPTTWLEPVPGDDYQEANQH